jgi:hypothetical protein
MTNFAPGNETSSYPSTEQIVALLDNEQSKLTAGKTKRPKGSLLDQHNLSDRVTESLGCVLFIGGSTAAIVERRDSTTGALKVVDVVLLPVGNCGRLDQQQSSALLATYNLDNAAEQTFVVGRQEVMNVSGVEDLTISRKHLTILVSPRGVELVDESTNGTRIISEDTLLTNEVFGGLSDDSRKEVAGFVKQFNDKPWLWDSQNRGRTVINPYELP